MSVQEWEDGKVLTWSGRWHIVDPAYVKIDALGRETRGLCGAYGYKFETVPTYVKTLQDIKKGVKQAPTCKKCEKAAAK